MEKQTPKNVDAKAAAVKEKLNDESLDKCKVEGGGMHYNFNKKPLIPQPKK